MNNSKKIGNGGNNNKCSNKSRGKRRDKQGQPKADSRGRVNFDNTREDKFKRDVDRDMKSGKFNDVSWYAKNPTLLRAASSIPIAPVIGTPDDKGAAIPGIFQYCWYPSLGPNPGGSTVDVDEALVGSGSIKKVGAAPIAINQAADSTYSFTVHANSRTYVYDAVDQMMIIQAGIQVFSILQAVIRAYGTIKFYSETNRYLPDTLITAMGFDPSDMRKHLAQIWFDINNLIDQSRQIWIPNVFPLLKRWMWLNASIFKDAEGSYAQLYVPVQNMYYTYSETVLQTGGALLPITVSGTETAYFQPGETAYPWRIWKETIQAMINNLINSQDRGIMYGDLLKAYGTDKIFAMPPIGSDYMTVPEYSMEVLMQIENMHTTSYHMNGIIQQNNKLFPTFMDTGHGHAPGMHQVLNFHTTSDVTPEMIMLATRLTASGINIGPYFKTSYSNADKKYTVQPAQMVVSHSTGTETVDKWRVIYSRDTVAQMPEGYISFPASAADVGYSVQGGQSGSVYGRMMAFDWHPFRSTIDSGEQVVQPGTATSTVLVQAGDARTYYGDYDKYAYVDFDALDKIHNTAVYSLFDVPQM